MKLPISIINKDPILRETAQPLMLDQLKSPKIQALIDVMIPTMYEEDGVGLAAPQVGKSLRLIVIGLTKDDPMVFVNPEITYMGKKTQVQTEGCLSIPETSAPVRRAEKVRVKALDRDGNKIKLKASGLLARVFQHEIDHLNGVLFIDRVEDKKLIEKHSPKSAL